MINAASKNYIGLNLSNNAKSALHNSTKLNFTAQLERLLKMALPNLACLSYQKGSELNTTRKCNDYYKDDEFIIATMANGAQYTINITANSHMAILSDVLKTLQYK